MRYSYQTVYTDPALLARDGYGKVAHIPCIFDSRPGYHRLGSHFLIDRGLGVWDPRHRGDEQLPVPPSRISIKNYADRLSNFLEWCETRALDPMVVEYSCHIIGKYQAEMLTGVWSRSGRSLSEQTINTRVEVAIEFLTWASDKNLREALSIPMKTRVRLPPGMVFSGKEPVLFKGREGKLHVNQQYLSLPSDQELNEWRARLLSREVRGQTEILIADLICETAIRREEAACWRIDTLPLDSKEWKVVNPQAEDKNKAVLVDIKFGTKGKEYGRDHGDKIGPRGTIRLPYLLALRLHEYRERLRSKALAIAVRKGDTLSQQRKIRENAVHLFLNPTTGDRYTGGNIYEFWRYACPPLGWSPHKARHFWACSILWSRLESQRVLLEEAQAVKKDMAVLHALQCNALAVIQLEIQPQLRHKSEDTTLKYLQWLSNQLGINVNFHELWTAELDDGESV